MVKKKGKVIYHNNLIELISLKEVTPLYYDVSRPTFPVLFREDDPRIYELVKDLENPVSKLIIPKSFKPMVVDLK
jgi:hypothetical protein